MTNTVEESRYTTTNEQGEIPKSLKTAVLISNKGTGSNLQAIIDAGAKGELPMIDLGLVISDTPDAYGLIRAANHGIRGEVVTFGKKIDRDGDSKRLAEELNLERVDLTVMAGWSKILTRPFFDEYKGVALNVHPGALPEEDGSPHFFPDGTPAPWNQGQMTEAAVQNFLGLKFASSTVHVATINADSGPVLERSLIKVDSNDTLDSLYDRMKQEEWAALIRALKDPKRILDMAKK